MKKRIEFIDVAKGLAIVGMISGHLVFMPGGGNGISAAIKRAVHPFHVPLFFLVAGFFLTTSKPWSQFLKDKARRLLIPYALGVAALVLAGCCSPASAFFGSALFFDDTLIGKTDCVGPVWFLMALFLALSLARLSLRWRYGGVALFALAAAAFAWNRLGLKWLPLDLVQVPVCAAYVYLGRKLCRDGDFPDRFNKPAVVVGGGLWALQFFGGWELSVAGLIGPVWTYPAAVFVVASVLWLSRLLLRLPAVGAFFRRCGENSLVILLMHQIYFMAGGDKWFYNHVTQAYFLNAAVFVILPLLGASLIFKVRSRL